MELPITVEKMRQFTDKIKKERDNDLHEFVNVEVCDPQYILKQLQIDIKESIEKDDKRTQFSYPISSYYRIYQRFGKKDTDRAMLQMATRYRDKHFPMANMSINDETPYNVTTNDTVRVMIHFSLPWISGQTSSHPQST
jgi:hypothetical protein